MILLVIIIDILIVFKCLAKHMLNADQFNEVISIFLTWNSLQVFPGLALEEETDDGIRYEMFL